MNNSADHVKITEPPESFIKQEIISACNDYDTSVNVKEEPHIKYEKVGVFIPENCKCEDVKPEEVDMKDENLKDVFPTSGCSQALAAEKPFACLFCDYRCSRKWMLTIHVRTHTGEKPFTCNSCNRNFSHKFHLTDHLRIHTGEKPYICFHCDYKCTQKWVLINHLRTHEKRLNCTFCSFDCSRKTDLALHIRTHIEAKPLKCSLCDYRCCRKRDLNYHLKIHADVYLFSCSLCDYKCSELMDLNNHVRGHECSRNLCVCEFEERQPLTYHLRQTDVEQSTKHDCPFCDNICLQENDDSKMQADKPLKSNAEARLKTYTCKKPFACYLCEYRAIKESTLQKHMALHVNEMSIGGSNHVFEGTDSSELRKN